MKKIVIGLFAFITGMISSSVLLGATLFRDLPIIFTSGGTEIRTSFLNILSNYGLMPALYIYIAISGVGIILCVWGIWENRKGS